MNAVLKGFLSVAVVLTVAVAFRSNFTGLGMPGLEEGFPHAFRGFDSSDELMVKNRLTAARAHGIFSEGGFLLEGESRPVPYKSRTGLQGQILAFAYVHSDLDLASFVPRIAFLMDLALAATLLLFCLAVQREFGWIAAGTVLVLLLFSDWIVFFSGSLYWVTFSFFLPFVFSILWYPKLLNGTISRHRFLVIVGLLVFLKALLGYEFATNVLLSATVPVLYFDILARKRWKDIARMIVVVALAGMAGLAAAITIHTLQSWLYHGSLKLALAHFADRAANRSIHSPQIHYGLLLRLNRDIYKYLTVGICTMFRLNGKLIVSLPLYALNVILVLAFTFSLVDTRFVPALKTDRRKLIALCAASSWGLLCSLTWFFIALNHTYSHVYMDPLMFYIPYGLLIYALFGAIVSITLQRLRTLWRELPAALLVNKAGIRRRQLSPNTDVEYETAAPGTSVVRHSD